MMKWAFQIERTTLDNRNLVDLLDCIGYQPAHIPGLDLAFWSKEFEACVTASEVWEEVKRIRDLVSEVTDIDPEFVLGPVIDLSSGEPKRHHFLEAKSGIVVTVGLDATLTVSPPDNLSEEQIAEWNSHRAEQEYQDKLEAQRAKLVPAFREPRAVKLLHLLKRDSHTGESMYKIYELAEGHPSRRKEFHERFGISEVDFRRFADTVHNPAVSGELARHAYDDKPKTVNPMSIAEAESFVMGIARRWLSSLRD
ncbi:MAG: hypothetical protein ACYDAA_18070 [Syntrophales bacterium]